MLPFEKDLDKKKENKYKFFEESGLPECPYRCPKESELREVR